MNIPNESRVQPVAAQMAAYSERGPVFVARSYQETPETADFQITLWEIADLDGHVIAREMAESNARQLAQALNSHAALVAALDETVRQIEVVRLSGYIDECAALDGSLHHTVNAALAALAQAKGEA